MLDSRIPEQDSDYLHRPGLQKLLRDCESGLIDIIVTYRLDRLSRSITDFADLTKKFDE
ncbi:MAG: recombinase family protein [Lentisphaeria bacterium]|nr:recombinase family protein [Lentisphaeria bacterium]